MISLSHRTVFVHIRKTGGQSIEKAFLSDLGLSWEHRFLLFVVTQPLKSRPTPRVRFPVHLTVQEYLEHDYLPRELWDSFYRFATVRNPYGRIESFYFFWKMQKSMTFEEFVIKASEGTAFERGAILSQSEYLVDGAGQLGVQDVIRLEQIGPLWPRVRSASGLSVDLPHRNRSARKPVTWTDRMREAMVTRFADDFALFGYSPEDGSLADPRAGEVLIP